jgi:hypothetical protein
MIMTGNGLRLKIQQRGRTDDRRQSPRRYVRDRRQRQNIWPGITIGVHLAVACAGLYWSTRAPESAQRLFDQLALEPATFFRQLLLSGIILFALMLSLRSAGMWRSRRYSPVYLAAALSVTLSVLLAAEAWKVPTTGAAAGANPARVEDWSTLTYLLFMEHRALLFTLLLTVTASVIAAYYIVRAVLRVRYEGTGFQLRLPGQTIYHVPLFPQVSWQRTYIHLHEGDTVDVEITGQVSPGALQGLSKLEQLSKAFHRVVRRTISPEQYHEDSSKIVPWPYTGPEGYPRGWYHDGETKAPVLKEDPLYKENDYYKKDPYLTVRGLPHNVVVGMICSAGEEPRKATFNEPGYDYANADDQGRLICLSSSRYPIEFEANRSGELYLVINDVDEVRWDNAGLFFVKIVHHT